MSPPNDNLFANPTTGLSTHADVNRLRHELLETSKQPSGISGTTLAGAISNLQAYKPVMPSGGETAAPPPVDIQAEAKKIEAGIGLTATPNENGHTWSDETPEGEPIKLGENSTFKAASEGLAGDWMRSFYDGSRKELENMQFGYSVINNDKNTNIVALEQKLHKFRQEANNPQEQRWNPLPDRDPDGTYNWTAIGGQILTGTSPFMDADWWGNLFGGSAPSIVAGVTTGLTTAGIATATVVGAPAAPIIGLSSGATAAGTAAGLGAMGGVIIDAYIMYRSQGMSTDQAYDKAYSDAGADALKSGALAGAAWLIAPLRLTRAVPGKQVGSTIAVTGKGKAILPGSTRYPMPKGKLRLTFEGSRSLRELGKQAFFQSALVQPSLEVTDAFGSNLIAKKGYDPKRNLTDGFLDAWIGSMFMDGPAVTAGGLYTYARGGQKIIPAFDDPNNPSSHKEMQNFINKVRKAEFLAGRGEETTTSTSTDLTIWKPYNVRQLENGEWQVSDQVNDTWEGPTFKSEEEARAEQDRRNSLDADAHTSGLNTDSADSRLNFLDWQMNRLKEYDQRMRENYPKYKGSERVWRAVRFLQWLKESHTALDVLLDPIERKVIKTRGKKGQPPTARVEEREKTLEERNHPDVLKSISGLQEIVDMIKVMMNPSIMTKNNFWVFRSNAGKTKDQIFKVLTDKDGNVAPVLNKKGEVVPGKITILDPRKPSKRSHVSEKSGVLEDLGQRQPTNALMQGDIYSRMMSLVEAFEIKDNFGQGYIDAQMPQSGESVAEAGTEEVKTDTQDTEGQEGQEDSGTAAPELSPEEEFGGADPAQSGEPDVEVAPLPPKTGMDGILQYFSGAQQENVRTVLDMYRTSLGVDALNNTQIMDLVEYLKSRSPKSRIEPTEGEPGVDIKGVFEDLSSITSDTFERGVLALRRGQDVKAGELLRTVTHELVHLAIAVKRIHPESFGAFWRSKEASDLKFGPVSKDAVEQSYAARSPDGVPILDANGNPTYTTDENGLGEELVAELLSEMATGRFKGRLPNEGNLKYIVRQFMRVVREFFDKRKDRDLVNDYLENFRGRYYIDTGDTTASNQRSRAHRAIRPMNERSLAADQSRVERDFPGVTPEAYPAGVYLPMDEGPKEPFNDKTIGGVTTITVNNKIDIPGIGERWIPRMIVGAGLPDEVSHVSAAEWDTIVRSQEWIPVKPRVHNKGKPNQFTVPAGQKLANPTARVVNLVNPHPNGARRNWQWVKKVGNSWVPDKKKNKDAAVHLVSIQSTTNPGPDAGGFRAGNPDGHFTISGEHVYSLNYEAHTPVKLTVFDEAPTGPRLRPTTFADKLSTSKKIVGHVFMGKSKEAKPVYDTISLTNKADGKLKFHKVIPFPTKKARDARKFEKGKTDRQRFGDARSYDTAKRRAELIDWMTEEGFSAGKIDQALIKWDAANGVRISPLIPIDPKGREAYHQAVKNQKVNEQEDIARKMLEEGASDIDVLKRIYGGDKTLINDVLARMGKESLPEVGNVIYLVEPNDPKFHRVWHGTGADTLEGNKLQLSFVGNTRYGEGAQMAGWGLYFADLYGVAKSYRDKHRAKSFAYKGVTLNNEKFKDPNNAGELADLLGGQSDVSLINQMHKQEVLQLIADAAVREIPAIPPDLGIDPVTSDMLKREVYQKEFDKAKIALADSIAAVKESQNQQAIEGEPRPKPTLTLPSGEVVVIETPTEADLAQQKYDTAEEFMGWMHSLNIDDITLNKGSVFEVDLAPETSEYLNFDGYLTQQSEAVQTQLRPFILAFQQFHDFKGRTSSGIEAQMHSEYNYGQSVTGEMFYRDLASLAGGITYWDNQSYYSENRSQTTFSNDFHEYANDNIILRQIKESIITLAAPRSVDSRPVNPERGVSLFLNQQGIPGNKFKDFQSRDKTLDQGTYNYVLYDEDLIEINSKMHRVIPDSDRTVRNKPTGQPQRSLGGFLYSILPSVGTPKRPGYSQWHSVVQSPSFIFGGKNDVGKINIERIWDDVIEEYAPDNGDVLVEFLRKKYNSKIIPEGNEFWIRSLSLSDRARYWYELSSEKFTEVFGSHGPTYLHKVIDTVAATSMQANPVDNLLRTIALLAEDMQGKPINTDVTSLTAVTDALNPDEYLRSDKIGNFSNTFAYLMGLRDDKPLSTNDRQVAAYFNMKAEAISNPTKQAIVEKGTKILAVDGDGKLVTKVTDKDGLENINLPSMYDMISSFHIKLRNELNNNPNFRHSKANKTDGLNQEIEPFETWQLQALAWVQQRIDSKGAKSANDDYAQVIDRVVAQLQQKGIMEPNQTELTNDVLHDERVPYELRATLEPYMNTHMASVPVLEKFEKLNNKDNTVLSHHSVLRDLLEEAGMSATASTAIVNMDNQFLRKLSIRKGKILVDGKYILPPMPSKSSDKSLVSQLASLIADSSLDFTRVVSGHKLANGVSRPTLRIPTHILNESQREVFLSYMARLLQHDKLVAHQFRPKENINSIREAHVETIRVFVRTKTKNMVGEKEALQVSDTLGRVVEGWVAANGYVMDIVPDINSPLSDKAIQDATKFLNTYGDVNLIAVDYNSLTVEDAASTTALTGLPDPDALSQQRVIGAFKRGLKVNTVREIVTKHPQLSKKEIGNFLVNDNETFINQSTGESYSKAVQETVGRARNTLNRRLDDIAFVEAEFEKILARELEKREAWNDKYGDQIAKAVGLEEYAPKFHRRPIALVPEMQGEGLTSIAPPPEVREEVAKYLRVYPTLTEDQKRSFLNRFVRNSVVGMFTASAKRIFQIGRRTDAAMRLANWIDRDKYAMTGVGKTGIIAEDVHGQIQEVIARYTTLYSKSLIGLTRKQKAEIPHILRGKYKDAKGRTNLALIEGGFPVENAVAIRNIFNGLYGELKSVYAEQGMQPPPDLINYFPQKYEIEGGQYKDTGLSKQDALTEFLRVVMEPKKATGRQKDRARHQAEIAVNKIIGEGFQPTWGFDFGEFAYDKNYKMEPQELRRLINVDPYRTFNVTLADGRVVPMSLVEFLSNDAGMVIQNYITTTSRRTVFAKRFGLRGQFVKDIVDLYKRDKKGRILLDAHGNKVLGDIDQELKDRGEPLLTVDERKDMYELVRLNMGLQNRISHKWQGYTHALRFWGNITLLSLATVQSLAEPILIGSRLGLWPMLNGVGYSMRTILRTPFVATKAATKAMGSANKGRRWNAFMDHYGFDVLDAKTAAKDMGIIFESMQYVLQNSAESASHVRWERWNNRFFRSILLQPLTEMQQAAAFTASIRALPHWARMANKGKEKYKRYLKEVGLVASDLRSFDMRDPVGTANMKVRGALRQLNSEIIMAPDPGRKPGWMSDPRFALVAHIKSWIFTFNNTVLQRSMRTLIKDKNPMPLIYLVGFGISNAMLYEWREWMRYGDEGNPYMARIGLGKDNPMRTAYLAMERGGLFGPAQYGVDLVLGTRIATGYSLAGTLIPTLNIVDRGLGGIGSFVEAPFAENPQKSVRNGLNDLTRAIPLINTMGNTRVDFVNRVSGYTPGSKSSSKPKRVGGTRKKITRKKY